MKINIEKKGNDKSPNIAVKITVNKFIGITIFNGFIIILKAKIVNPAVTNFFNAIYNNFI